MLSTFENFNAKVRVTRPSTARDTRGGLVKTYITVAQNVPALVVNSSAYENKQYGGERSGRSGTATFPFLNDVRPQDRIVWGERTLVVRGVDPIRHNEDGTTSALRVTWDEIDESPVARNPSYDAVSTLPVLPSGNE